MDIREIERRIDEISRESDDDESAHALEDALYYGLLLAIAEDRCADISGCTRAAIKTREIEFERWCA